MPKANLVLPNGTTVTIDGTTEEVAALLATYTPAASTASVQQSKAPRRGPVRSKRKGKGGARPSGLTAFVQGLRDTDYFKQKRTILDVKAKLEEGGHHYGQAAIAQTLLNLTRRRELRRLKENVATTKGKGRGKKNRVWVYVQ